MSYLNEVFIFKRNLKINTFKLDYYGADAAVVAFVIAVSALF